MRHLLAGHDVPDAVAGEHQELICLRQGVIHHIWQGGTRTAPRLAVQDSSCTQSHPAPERLLGCRSPAYPPQTPLPALRNTRHQHGPEVRADLPEWPPQWVSWGTRRMMSRAPVGGGGGVSMSSVKGPATVCDGHGNPVR